jgi:hypothetical protein
MEVVATFGNPRPKSVALDAEEKPDPAWERANMVVARDLPGKWNGGRGRLYCHRLAEPYIREALRRCAEYGVLDYIERLGCFCYRYQRHDAHLPLSYHSWGIALDVNAADNAGKYLHTYPRPWSAEWMALWPKGVPVALVAAFETVGFNWGGRWKSYTDPMHLSLGPG